MNSMTLRVLRGRSAYWACSSGGGGSASHLVALPNCALYKFADLAASEFFSRRRMLLPFIVTATRSDSPALTASKRG